MQDQHVPAIGRWYWPLFAAAILFASTVGDLLIVELGQRGLSGLFLPALALALAVVLYAEVRDHGASLRWYWLAVIIVMTGSNHLADLTYLFLGLRRIWVCIGLIVLLIIAHLAFQSDAARIIALRLQQRPQPTVPLTDVTYWIAMVLTCTAGTLAADYVSIGLNVGLPVDCLLCLLALAGAAALRRWTTISRTLTYWLIVFVLIALGTAIADLLADDPGVGLGLRTSVAITGAIFAVLVVLSAERQPAPEKAG